MTTLLRPAFWITTNIISAVGLIGFGYLYSVFRGPLKEMSKNMLKKTDVNGKPKDYGVGFIDAFFAAIFFGPYIVSVMGMLFSMSIFCYSLYRNYYIFFY